MTDDDAQLPLPPGFTQALLSLLEQGDGGLDEFSLIKRLAERYPASPFADPDALRDPLKLFRVHFLLFHSLYRLADELLVEGRQLRIHALGICLEPLPASAAGLRPADLLRKYYLDVEHWRSTQREDVEALLEAFWRGTVGSGEEVQAAHELFGLSEPAGAAQVRRRYRALVATHHPDRGGDTETAQRINEAYIILKRYYGAL
jgi:hypothetical protein